jgi:hypothetical protein
MQVFQDVFLSYGRTDSLELASRLNRRLVDLGFTVWFDYADTADSTLMRDNSNNV